jgi:hypothetical protein
MRAASAILGFVVAHGHRERRMPHLDAAMAADFFFAAEVFAAADRQRGIRTALMPSAPWEI